MNHFDYHRMWHLPDMIKFVQKNNICDRNYKARRMWVDRFLERVKKLRETIANEVLQSVIDRIVEQHEVMAVVNEVLQSVIDQVIHSVQPLDAQSCVDFVEPAEQAVDQLVNESEENDNGMLGMWKNEAMNDQCPTINEVMNDDVNDECPTLSMWNNEDVHDEWRTVSMLVDSSTDSDDEVQLLLVKKTIRWH